MAFVQTLGSAVKGASSLTTVLTVSVTTTAGNRVIVAWSGAASALAQTYAVTDSKGNTWNLDGSKEQSAALIDKVFSSVLTTPLVSGDTITVTQGGTATANGFIKAQEHSGLPVTTTTVTSVAGGSSTNVATATSGGLTVASGADYFGVIHMNNGTTPATTGSLSSPWNARETGVTGTSNLHSYAVWDQTQASGATVTLNPTLSSSAAYAALLVAYAPPTTASSTNALGFSGTTTPAAPTAAAAGSLGFTGSSTSVTPAAGSVGFSGAATGRGNAAAAGSLALTGSTASNIGSNGLLGLTGATNPGAQLASSAGSMGFGGSNSGASVALASSLGSLGLLGSNAGVAQAASAGSVSLLGTGVSGPVAVMHSWVGAPTPGGFRVRSRMTGATSVRLAVSTSPAMTGVIYFGPQTPTANGYVDFLVTGMAAATQYYYQLANTPAGSGESLLGSVGKAKTLPAIGQAGFKFAFGGCTNGHNVNREAVDDIRAWGADFFMHLGDFHYKSSTSTDPTVHRQGWEDQIQFAPGLLELCRDVPMWYCRSDHEAGPDNGDSNNAYTAASIAGYQQLVPYGPLGDTGGTPAGLYQTWVVGRVRFILIDIRNTDRSPGSNTDNSSKTMLGATQKAWLKAQLLQPEPVKVIVSDVAWMGPADIVAKPDAWWSYATERTEIASYIAANNVQVLFLHSDTHTIACASPAKNIYGGFPVYCAAPLANTGGGRDLSTFDATYSTTPTTTDSRQYGRVTVTDTGTAITFVFSGWDAVTASQQVGRTDVFQTPAPSGSIGFSGFSAPAAAAAASTGALGLGGSAVPVVSGHSSGALAMGGNTAAPGTVLATATGTMALTGSSAVVVNAASAGALAMSGAATAPGTTLASASGSLGFSGASSKGAAPVGDLSAEGLVTMLEVWGEVR